MLVVIADASVILRYRSFILYTVIFLLRDSDSNFASIVPSAVGLGLNANQVSLVSV